MYRPAILTALQGYDRSALKRDLLAGVSVALVAVPLSIAIAIASGGTPAQGLVTAVVAGLLISALGGSPVQIGGPTGAFIVVVASVVAAHGMDGLIIATFMAGVILLVAGLARLGSLIRLVPEPVIDGFTIGIAAIIATSQLKDVLGLTITGEPADFLDKIPALWAVRGSFSWAAVLVGIATIVAIRLTLRYLPRWPALIVAVAVGSALAAVLPGVETIGDRFGALPHGLPAPHLPALSLERLRELIPSALVIAFLAGIESLLSAVVADRMTGGKHKPNAEIVAQGVANIASSLVGGLPATGAIARTATNIRAGGQTPIAGIAHAAAVLAVMMVAAPLAAHLPLASLAGILLMTAWNMSEPAKWPSYARLPWPDLFLLLLTFALTLAVSLTVAIGTGVALGLALRMRRRQIPAADWNPRDR